MTSMLSHAGKGEKTSRVKGATAVINEQLIRYSSFLQKGLFLIDSRLKYITMRTRSGTRMTFHLVR